MQKYDCLTVTGNFTEEPATKPRAASRFCLRLILLSTLGVSYHATALAAPFAYVADYHYSISAFDTATNTVSEPVALKIALEADDHYSPSISAMVMNPAGKTIYIADNSVNKVRVLDVASNTVTANIKLKTAEVECSPRGIAINPAGTQLFVTGRNSDGSGPVPAVAGQNYDCTAVINTSTNQVKIFPIDYSSATYSGNVTYINKDTVYTTDSEDFEIIRVVDTATNTLKATIPAFSPSKMVINPAGTRVYVIEGVDSISVIDTTTHSKIAEIKKDGVAFKSMVVNPAGTRLYVLNSKGASVVIDTTTNTIMGEIKGPIAYSYSPSNNMAINPEGTRVYVFTDKNMYIIDTASNAVIKTVKVGGSLLAMAPIYQLAASSTTTANCLFNWAEANYPTTFNPATQNTQQITGYDYRSYSGTNTYLGVYQGNNIHILQPNVSPNIVDVGTVAQFKPITGCQ